MRLQSCSSKVVTPRLMFSLFVLSLSSPALSFGQTRAVVPDAQVQASVLRSLADAPELASQAINASTSGGVVTLSGSVQDDSQRRRADQIASTTPGVQRVIDELTVGKNSSPVTASTGSPGVLQSDGSYAAADSTSQQQVVSQANVAVDQAAPVQEVPPPNGPDMDPYGHPLNGQQTTPYPANQQQGYPAQQSRPSYGGYNQPGYNQPYQAQQPAYGQQPYAQSPGQAGGQPVTVPAGTVLRIRVNQHLNSRDVNVGTPFDAMVVNDIVANGQVAIPRGTFVQGTVVEAESSGHLKGRGELGLKLTQVTLGGQNYPIISDVFSAHGADKTIQSVNSTLGLGALGAIFGAVAGGGAGAAIGAGVGGAAGLGASAASGRGDVFIPSEALLSFRLIQPASVTTVPQAEMQRLASGVPTENGRPQIVRRYPYYGPVVYPRYYYRPYGYYPY